MWASTDQLRQEMVSKINEIIDKVNEPVEMNSPLQRTDALDEKEEEVCEHKGGIRCWECGDVLGKEEPKSTLREDIKEILCEAMFLKTEYLDPTGNKDADKIISLFKDTLLKEIDKLISIDGGYGYDRREIEQIIQNL